MIARGPSGLDLVERIIQFALDLSIPLYRAQVLTWIKQISRADSAAELPELAKLDPRIQRLIYQAIIATMLVAQNQAKKVVNAQLGRQVYAVAPKVFRFAETPIEGDFIFDEVISRFGLAERLFDMKTVTAYQEYKSMDGYAKQTAFSIARLESARAILGVRDSLRDSYKEGRSFVEWRKGVADVFAGLGVTPLKPWHLETVWRTNLMSTYNLAEFDFNRRSDYVAGLQYVATMDGRERASHGGMNGHIYPKDSPVWNSWLPPVDYNCRCTTIPITWDYMKRNGLSFSGPAPTAFPKGDPGPNPSFRRDLTGSGSPFAEFLRRVEREAAELEKLVGERPGRVRRRQGGQVVTPPPVPPVPPVAPPPPVPPVAQGKPTRKAKTNDEIFAELDAMTRESQIGTWIEQNTYFREPRGGKGYPPSISIDVLKRIARRLRHLSENYFHPRSFIGPNGDILDENNLANFDITKLSSDLYAHANPLMMEFNESWLRDMERFGRSLKKSVETGFHPNGCDTMESVIDHEFAHVLTAFSTGKMGAGYRGSNRTPGGKSAKQFERLPLVIAQLRKLKGAYTRELNKFYKVQSAEIAARLNESLEKQKAIQEKIYALSRDDVYLQTPVYKALKKELLDERTVEMKIRDDFKKSASVRISGYAGKNLDEFIAEGFCAALNDPNCSEYAKKIKELLDSVFLKTEPGVIKQ